ncbi:MAG: low molecular weight phosphotyrosine protein phosphatase [Ruminococcus flavefaciens]|nr:low molecular weight phosphotyrosine protein phosphatase [Ruminococcus flavefaciens]MCM1229867.1 low molecular weight phosphotyrosine protein phosphatase [Ruminococcus flavefaciens]
MKRIMFVYHGNICRSPMAEFIFKDMIRKNGRESEFAVSSSATSTEEIWNGIGNPVYPPAREKLAEHGISCDGKRAVQLKKSDYDKYDFFFCMDSRNIANAMRIFGGDPDNKIRRLLKNRDVSDPWYTDRFDVAYNDIYDGCQQLMEIL